MGTAAKREWSENRKESHFRRRVPFAADQRRLAGLAADRRLESTAA